MICRTFTSALILITIFALQSLASERPTSKRKTVLKRRRGRKVQTIEAKSNKSNKSDKSPKGSTKPPKRSTSKSTKAPKVYASGLVLEKDLKFSSAANKEAISAVSIAGAAAVYYLA
mmetsp:Transcript_6192/g.8849  ORF Transcript_6192/g.8849 Transcript_6192/m.8849 type:complete len:117 (-) Transcript_6192:211-561(-)